MSCLHHVVDLDIYSHSYFRTRFVIQCMCLCFCLWIVPKFVCNLLFCLTPLWSEGSKLSMCNYSLEHICLVCICSYNCCLFFCLVCGGMFPCACVLLCLFPRVHVWVWMRVTLVCVCVHTHFYAWISNMSP